MESTFRPSKVDEFVHDIEKHVGVTPNVVELPGRCWEVRVEGEHLLATGYVRLRAMDGKAKFSSGKLIIDGEERPTADDLRQLRSLWDRYENGVIHEPPELPDWDGDLDELPAPVRKLYDELAKVEAQRTDEPVDQQFVTRVSYQDGLWLVGTDSLPGTSAQRTGYIRIAFRKMEALGRVIWVPEASESIFIVDGMRCRVKTLAELNELLLTLLNAQRARPASASSGPISHGHSSTPGKANSVAVRRATVVRV